MQRKCLYLASLLLLAVLIALFGVFVRDTPEVATTPSAFVFSLTQDIGLMMFLGLASIYAYAKFSSLTGVGFCMVLTPVSLLCYTLWDSFWSRVFFGFSSFFLQNQYTHTYLAYFCAGAILIALGGVYGKLGLIEALIFTVLEVCAYSLNETICIKLLHCTDSGGSLLLHIFGGAFGLVMCFLYRPVGYNHPNNRSDKDSDYLGLVGSIFLWIFWPSFNAGVVPDNRKAIAIINTILSLSSSVVGAVAFSLLFEKRVSMVDFVNSSLAGGIIGGAACDYLFNPAASLLVGLFGSFLSVFCFKVAVPKLRSLGVDDTAGIFNLHFIPGIFGGFFSSIIIAFYDTLDLNSLMVTSTRFVRPFKQQAWYQAFCTVISTVMGLAAGALAGVLLRYLFQSGYEQHLSLAAESNKREVGAEQDSKMFFFSDYSEWNIEVQPPE